jgi:3,4-dihydroxy 2-butanone 4-phosphate synthase/GTP cyclohydrolase II
MLEQRQRGRTEEDGTMAFAPILEALDAIRRGEMVVVVDSEDRENEGDLIMAAELVTAEDMVFIVRQGAGLVCTAITAERADLLELPLMVARNTERERTAFTITVDAKVGTTTGISAEDRAATARVLGAPGSRGEDLLRPGHMNVLRAQPGGVLQRAGHTEAAVDLARLAGLQPAGILCEVLSATGTGMARRPELERFAEQHGLLVITIADLVRHRRELESLVTHRAQGRVPTPWGSFACHAFDSTTDGLTHLAFVHGNPAGIVDPLVRVHSECLTGDVFSSLRCDCGDQLRQSMEMVANEGHGVVVYLRGHEGRGIGISAKLQAYELQDRGVDTLDANLALGLPVDSREYGVGAQILTSLGLSTMRLMTNNPTKRGGLEGYGLTITEVVPLASAPTGENIRYLRTKRDRMGHSLEDLETSPALAVNAPAPP